jgi:hypothetical protein
MRSCNKDKAIGPPYLLVLQRFDGGYTFATAQRLQEQGQDRLCRGEEAGAREMKCLASPSTFLSPQPPNPTF